MEGVCRGVYGGAGRRAWKKKNAIGQCKNRNAMEGYRTGMLLRGIEQ